MIEILSILIVGITAGVLAGMMPGIGVLSSMLLLYPWLITLSGEHLIFFYITLSSTTQYIGSIPATFFGIPGESTSIPAVKEGHALYLNGKGAYAISGAALASFFGSILILILIGLFFKYIYNIANLYSTYLQLLLLLLIAVSIILMNNRILVSLTLMIAGYLLGQVGCDNNRECFATFNNDNLTTGLPPISILIALYVFPTMCKYFNHTIFKIPNANVQANKDSYLSHIGYFFKNIMSSIRGTLIGFFSGLVPGASLLVASNFAYYVERLIQKYKKKYKTGNYNCLVSAEAANNAAIPAILLPLLLFGIPMVPSEALLYDIASNVGFKFGTHYATYSLYVNIAIIFVIANLIGLLISWSFARYFLLMSKINLKVIYAILMCVLTLITYIAGKEYFQEFYYTSVLFLFLPIGFMIKKYDNIPLIFCFLVSDRIDSVTSRFFQLIS
jgi:putative tricarboxylic transport membrane protein